jgi:integrase/recombinase XerD
MGPRFEQFIRERQYLHNVTPATVAWYQQSLKHLPSESPTQAELNAIVVGMRMAGRKATGCNCTLRAINAYLKWSGSPLKVPALKEPQLILPTFAAAQVSRLVTWKPEGFYQRRLHLLVLLLLDTGCRISEALSLRVRDIDFDNLLVTLDGKGQKQRIVPFSFALRKVLYRYVTEYRTPDVLLFASRPENPLGRRVVLRDVKLLCRRLGFDPPARTLHAFRHCFAGNYIRRGGNVALLQRILGHSSITTTMRYVNLQVLDLSAVHEKFSLLSNRH